MNTNIIDFIHTNFSDISDIQSLQNEIDIIINNLLKDYCFIPYYISSNIKINGIDNQNNLFNFSYLIPNLFRKCYLNNSANIPGICPSFIYKTKTVHFYPLLADENIIKSFLYFNFPVNIKEYNSNNNFLEKIIASKYIINTKKKNTTYSSYTQPIDIYNQIYSEKSMLTQLIIFYNYLSASKTATEASRIINTFDVKWDFTNSCLCYDGIIDNTYIIGNEKYDYIILNSYASIIYNFENIMEKFDTENLVLLNFIDNSLFTLLKYINEVFIDILLEIEYYISGKKFCEKDYMKINNIPTLLKLYKNFYSNQIFTYTKSLVNTSIINIKPKLITIEDYVLEFNNIYIKTQLYYSNVIYLTKVILLNGKDGKDAILLYSNYNNWEKSTIQDITFTYFYINIGFPSAVQVYNNYLNSNNAYKKYNNINKFIIDFNNYFISPSGAGYPYIIERYNEYINGGFYPGGGTLSYVNNLYPNDQNIGYIYKYFYQDNNNDAKYTIYLALESFNPYDYGHEEFGYGVALIINTNYNE